MVADSGLMNNDNIADLRSERLQIYHRTRIKNEEQDYKGVGFLGSPRATVRWLEYDGQRTEAACRIYGEKGS